MPKNKSGIGDWIDDLLGGDDTDVKDERESTLSGTKGGASKAGTDEGRGWHEDSAGHSEAAQQRTSSKSKSSGSKGGVSSRRRHTGHQLTAADRARGGRNAQRSGNAHELTDAERAAGGRS
jgi:hypothetical protein